MTTDEIMAVYESCGEAAARICVDVENTKHSDFQQLMRQLPEFTASLKFVPTHWTILLMRNAELVSYCDFNDWSVAGWGVLRQYCLQFADKCQ